MSVKSRIKANSFRPLRDNVFVVALDSGINKSRGGIILLDDDMTLQGVKDRWAQVYATGPDVEDIKVGNWVLIKHGRWTPGIDIEIAGKDERIWRVDYPESVLIATDSDPRENKPV
jgi:co-chaperonin GroES (HSP10)